MLYFCVTLLKLVTLLTLIKIVRLATLVTIETLVRLVTLVTFATLVKLVVCFPTPTFNVHMSQCTVEQWVQS